MYPTRNEAGTIDKPAQPMRERPRYCDGAASTRRLPTASWITPNAATYGSIPPVLDVINSDATSAPTDFPPQSVSLPVASSLPKRQVTPEAANLRRPLLIDLPAVPMISYRMSDPNF